MIWVILLLLLPLLAILIVPVWFKGNTQVVSQSAENLRLYQERCDELAASDLEDDVRQGLQLELDREFLANADGSADNGYGGSMKNRWALSLSLFAVALISTGLLYQYWGAGNEIRATELLNKSGQAELSELEREELITRLQAATEKQPDVVEWGYLRARLLNADGQFAQAASAFADILVTLPEEAKADRSTTMTMLAQARFFAADQKADEKNYQLIQQALDIMPGNRQALGMAGILAFELKHYQQAIDHWRALWSGLPGGQEAQYLEQGIRRAAAQLEAEGANVDLSWLERTEIKVLVDLSAQAKADAQPQDKVFVLARAVAGPAVPLAAQKLTVADLPKVVTLSDTQAMMPGMNLSAHEQLVVVARISKSGQPMAQSGDWQTEKSPVSNKESELVKLVISERIK